MQRRSLLLVLGAIAIAACGLDVIGTAPATIAPLPDARVTPDVDTGSSPPGPDAAGCADTDADPANCGACGHACLGATCSQGMCAPTTLGSFKGPAGVAIAGTTAYVAENAGGVIYRVATDTPGAPAKVFDTQQAPRGLAIANGALYWPEQTKLRSVQIDGSADKDGPGVGNSVPIVVDGADVYFSNGDATKISRVNLDLSSNSDISNESGVTYGIAVDATNIYWTVDGNSGAALIRMRARNGGPSPHTITDSETHPESIVVDGTTLYWTTADAIRTAQVPDGGASNLVGGELQPRSLASDGDWLYWLEVDTGSLKAISKHATPGTHALILATGERMRADLQYSTAIAFDADYVYYLATDSADGALKRVPKLR